ncbi:hypothetical protein OSB04_014563 [Centaurea solstitialis]|uniref:Membrane-associated kinase regulator 1 n=1 Tax=Centaurea solstitialis TaxID=347529 RepID=A0AA38T533_9ASTR|nr:hypothetical protein OSB04_014563 [Centaurea solstitialis]
MKPLNSHSQTLPSSPIHHHHHHSSSSDFEFTAALSPRKSTAANLRPADELFYNGRLLPLHLSSSNSMASTTLLLTTTTTTTTTGRHSSDYHSSFSYDHNQKLICNQEKKLLIGGKTFSFPRFSSVFRKETKSTEADHPSTITAKSMSATAKEKIRKYLKKVKPLYEKLSQQHKTTTPLPSLAKREDVVISQPFPGF